ncbi:hypothetical protein ACK3YP_00820 [Aeromonas allosaccharophila]|uniref:hypothetical protein n=1 Tax=Aeromonas allosaccharophila TaxID=656 RepID=UPI003986AC67
MTGEACEPLFLLLFDRARLTRPHFLTPAFPTRNTDQTWLRTRHLPLSGDGEEQGFALSRPFPPAITNKKVRFLTKFNYQLTD